MFTTQWIVKCIQSDPDFLRTIISDLTKLKYALRKKLTPAVVLDVIELICGSGSGWADSSVGLGYGSSASKNAHMYAKMALNILEKVAPSFSKGNSSEGQRKSKRSDSESVSGCGSSSFSFLGSDYGNSSGSTAGGRQSRGFHTVKKGSRVSRPQPGCHNQTLPWQEKWRHNWIIPAQGEFG